MLWLAFAEMQFDLGRLNPGVLKKARAVLDSGVAIGPFAGTPNEAARAKELARLARKLAKSPPKPKPVKAPPKKTPTQFAVGDLVLWKTSHGNLLLWVFGVETQSSGTCPRLELLEWIGDHPANGGHRFVWFEIFDLKRKRDLEGRYQCIASDFVRKGWVETRASKFGLGCSGCTFRGPTADFQNQIEREAKRLSRR